MMRRSAGFHADEARRQLLKEWQNVPALELTANDYITCRVNCVDLKNRLSDIETNCRDRLHVWLLRIVGASTAPTSMALPCRWRSRPQHQKRTHAPQHTTHGLRAYSISSSALASWRRQFETVPTPNVPGGRYPDRHGRDETRCLPESGSARLSRSAFNS